MTDSPPVTTVKTAVQDTKLYQQYPDLKRLARALRRSQGVFSLFFAECNLPMLRQQLATELAKQLETPPAIINLTELDTDSETIDVLITQQLTDHPDDAAIFLFGLEQLLPTLSSDKLRATVQQLNWRRSGLARLQRPLLIWLPRYALDILAEQTPDFYDWYSGVFSFPVQAEQRGKSVRDAFNSLHSKTDVHAAEHMSSEEKKRWLSTLKELIDEHPTRDKQRTKLLTDLGRLLRSMGDNKKASSYYQQSLQIQQEIGDKSGEGTTLNNISQIYSAKGDYDTALKYLEQALQIQQETGSKAREGIILNNLSQIYKIRGDYDTTLRYLEQALQIQQEIGDKTGQGTTLNNISQISTARGDYDTALKYLKQALQIHQEIGNKTGQGTTLNNTSQIFMSRNDYDTALKHLEQALKIFEEIGDKSSQGGTLNNISQIFKNKGDYDNTLKYLKQALKIQQETGDIAGLCTTELNINIIHWQNKKFEKAKSGWITVYQLAKKMNLAKILGALESLAPQIGLEGGLAGWEALAKSMASEEVESVLLNEQQTLNQSVHNTSQ